MKKRIKREDLRLCESRLLSSSDRAVSEFTQPRIVYFAIPRLVISMEIRFETTFLPQNEQKLSCSLPGSKRRSPKASHTRTPLVIRSGQWERKLGFDSILCRCLVISVGRPVRARVQPINYDAAAAAGVNCPVRRTTQ